MKFALASPGSALLTGLVLCAVILVLWVLTSGVDQLGLISFLIRWLHVLGAMIWVGLIWFVNFVQISAVQQADDSGRAALMKLVVPRVGAAMRHVAGLTALTGFALLIATGYLFDRWVFNSAVYVAPAKLALLWGGALAGIAMWAIVTFVIGPNLSLLLADPPAPQAARVQAAQRVATFARINLVLALPVTLVMIAAAHLY